MVFSRFIFVIASLFVVVSLVAYVLISSIITQFVTDDSKTSLSFIINNIEANYYSKLQALETLSDQKGFIPFNKNRAQKVMEQFLAYGSVFSTLHVYDKSGPLLIHVKNTNVKPYKIRGDFRRNKSSFVNAVDEVIRTHEPVASETFYTSEGDLFQTFIVPIFKTKKKKEVWGVISGGVFPNIQKIDSLVQGLALSPKNFVVLSDINGNVIAQNNYNKKRSSKGIRDHIKESVLGYFDRGVPPEKVLFANSDDSPYLVFSRPIKSLKLLVTLGVGTSVITKKKSELVAYIGFGFIICIVIALIVSAFAVRRMSDPFYEIYEAIKEINLGNPDYKLRQTGNDEISLLVQQIQLIQKKIRKDKFLGDLWSEEFRDIFGKKDAQ